MKPNLYLIEGPCGAGKSTAIHSIRQSARHIAFVDPDVIKHRTYVLGDWDDWMTTTQHLGEDWRRMVATELSLTWISKLMALRRQIVIELCDTMQIHLQLTDMCSQFGYRLNAHLLLPSLSYCLEMNRLRTESVPFIDAKVCHSYSFYADKSNELCKTHSIHENQSDLVRQLLNENLGGISPCRKTEESDLESEN